MKSPIAERLDSCRFRFVRPAVSLAVLLALSPAMGTAEAQQDARLDVAQVPPAAGSAPADSAAARRVVLSNQPPFYTPATTEITVGDVVEWVNPEVSEIHSVQDRRAAFLSPDLKPGGNWCHRFQHEGEFEYTCRFHPWMRGKIVVRPPRPAVEVVQLSSQCPPTRLLQAAEDRVWWLGDGCLGVADPAGQGHVHPLPKDLKLQLEECAAARGRLWCLETASGRLRPLPDAPPGWTGSALEGARLTLLSGEPRGERLWFFDEASGRFGGVDPGRGEVQWRTAPALPGRPVRLRADGSGRLWALAGPAVVAIEAEGGGVREHVLPAGAAVSSLAVDAAGRAWLADSRRGKILKIENEWITEYGVPSRLSSPRGVAPDGEGVWFAEHLAGRIGRLRGGAMEELDLGGDGRRPAELVLSSDGGLWIADLGAAPRLLRIAHSPASPAAGDPCPPVSPASGGQDRARSH